MTFPSLLQIHSDRYWDSRADGRCRFTVAGGTRPCARDAPSAFGGLPVCHQHFEKLRQAAMSQLASEVVYDAVGGLLPSVRSLLGEADDHLAAKESKRRARARQKALRAAAERSLIYYAEREGYVKIGRTTNLTKRIKDLSRGGVIYPDGVGLGPVVLLATHKGGEVAEARLHERFATDRVAGEWFRKSDLLAAHIVSVITKQAARSTAA